MSKIKILFFILIPVFVFFDQLSKRWALENVFKPNTVIEINEYLNFVPVWNEGITFGLLSNIVNINFFMIIITTIIILFLFLWFIKTKKREAKS